MFVMVSSYSQKIKKNLLMMKLPLRLPLTLFVPTYLRKYHVYSKVQK